MVLAELNVAEANKGEVDACIGEYAKMRGRRQSVSAESLKTPKGNTEPSELFAQMKLAPLKGGKAHVGVSGAALDALCNVLESHPLFSHLDTIQRRSVAELFHIEAHIQGSTIIKQGDEVADMFYMLQAGSLAVHVSSSLNDSGSKEVLQYKADDSFGELALMYNQPRAATVTVTSGACTLLCLSRETFRLVLQSTVTDRNSYLETRLLNIPLLENLNKAQVAKLVDAVVTKTYAEGDVIIQKGELGDELFIMFDGTAVTSGSDIGADKVKYGPGEFFGELALLRDQPRAATVTATSLCTVCIVEKDAFTRLLGPCEEILRGRASEILHSSSGSDNADNNNASSSNSGNNSSGSAGL